MSVIIETSIGDMTVDLYTDERPRCSLNFLKLCKIKYYNFSLFHTVQENLMAQCGDPTATGRGGDSIFAKLYGSQARFFDMEVVPRIKHTKKGLVSMVNNGSGMHGSQFFITLGEDLDYLDGKHTVFGEVAEGMEVVDKLNNTFCGEDNRPHQDIRIYHTVLLDDPFDDPENLAIPDASPGPTEEMLNSDHIPCDANIEEDKEMTAEELAELEAEKEAKANTQILEMVGDLPDADVAPPENVLFVCKLNPVTTSDDLEIIFSRFGDIVSCEVIKDQKTGESLQYAFVEFSNPENCESAYFKMDNVLIDDRRIHVDFSQSVSKLKWKGKGKGVEIMTSGTAPNFILKNQQRQDDRYDLVYEDDIGADGDRMKRTKKDKKREDDRRPDNSDKNKKSKNLSRSPSPERRPKGNRDSDRSNHRRDRSRSRERDRQKKEERPRKRDDRSEDWDRFSKREEQGRRRHEEGRERERRRDREDTERYRDRNFDRNRDQDRFYRRDVDNRRNYERHREEDRDAERRKDGGRRDREDSRDEPRKGEERKRLDRDREKRGRNRSESKSRSRSRERDNEIEKRYNDSRKYDERKKQMGKRDQSDSDEEEEKQRKISKKSLRKRQDSDYSSDVNEGEKSKEKQEKKQKSKKSKEKKKKPSKKMSESESSSSDSSDESEESDKGKSRHKKKKKSNKSAMENSPKPSAKRRNDSSSESETERSSKAKKSKKSHKRKRSRERSSS